MYKFYYVFKKQKLNIIPQSISSFYHLKQRNEKSVKVGGGPSTSSIQHPSHASKPCFQTKLKCAATLYR